MCDRLTESADSEHTLDRPRTTDRLFFDFVSKLVLKIHNIGKTVCNIIFISIRDFGFTY